MINDVIDNYFPSLSENSGIDESTNIKTSIIAKAMGVNIFEKHFKLQNQKCVDEAVSIDPKKFIELRHEAILIDKIKGKQSKEIEKILGYLSKSEIIHKDDMVKL